MSASEAPWRRVGRVRLFDAEGTPFDFDHVVARDGSGVALVFRHEGTPREADASGNLLLVLYAPEMSTVGERAARALHEALLGEPLRKEWLDARDAWDALPVHGEVKR